MPEVVSVVLNKMVTSCTLFMFYKGQSILDGMQNCEKYMGQDLALSHIERDIFSRWMRGHDKGR